MKDVQLITSENSSLNSRTTKCKISKLEELSKSCRLKLPTKLEL